MTNNRWVQLCIFLALAGLMMAMSGYGFLSVIIILGLVFVSLRFATKPFSQAIARVRASIGWKFEIAIALCWQPAKVGQSETREIRGGIGVS